MRPDGRTDTTKLIWYMIYLLTAIGLSPGGRSTIHIYTQFVILWTHLTTGRLTVTAATKPVSVHTKPSLTPLHMPTPYRVADSFLRDGKNLKYTEFLHTALPMLDGSYVDGCRCPLSLRQQRHTGAVIQNRSHVSVPLMKFRVSPVCVRQPHLFHCTSRGHSHCHSVGHFIFLLTAYTNKASLSQPTQTYMLMLLN